MDFFGDVINNNKDQENIFENKISVETEEENPVKDQKKAQEMFDETMYQNYFDNDPNNQDII